MIVRSSSANRARLSSAQDWLDGDVAIMLPLRGAMGRIQLTAGHGGHDRTKEETWQEATVGGVTVHMYPAHKAPPVPLLQQPVDFSVQRRRKHDPPQIGCQQPGRVSVDDGEETYRHHDHQP